MPHEELIQLLIAKASEKGIVEDFSPISEKNIASCEKEMGVKLPELLKLVYSKVANGGIGPGESMLPFIGDEETVVALYDAWINSEEVWENFDNEKADVTMEWIPGVIPLCYWGGSVYTLLDCTVPGGMVVQCDLEIGNGNFKKEWQSNEEGVFQRPGTPLEEWLRAWLDDSKQGQFIPGEKLEENAPARAADQLDGESDSLYMARTAAQSGNANAMYEYCCALWKLGEKEKGEYWFAQALEHGSTRAQDVRISTLMFGTGCFNDWDKAYELNENEKRSHTFYITDSNFEEWKKKNPAFWPSAVFWWQKRAADGDAEAAFSLGLTQENGYGIPVDVDAAMNAFRHAAELGHAGAQKKLKKQPARKR